MRVLVTGGGGYLGSVLVGALVGRGHGVRVFDRFCFGGGGAAAWPKEAELEVITGDIRRLQEFPDLLDGIEGIIHLASLSNDPSCDCNTEMAHDVNVESALELARQAAQRGVRRFVLGSSCAVYGKGVFELLDEASPANPVSTFGETKLAAETAILKLHQKLFEPVVARTATMYGVSPRMRFDLAVNQMTATALRQQRIMVRGGGNQWRPFVHVVDAAEALCLLLEGPAAQVAGEIFNVGSDEQNIRIRDLAEATARACGEVPVEIAKDDDDLRTFRVQFAKLHERLGFQPGRTISEGIAELRAWLEEHPDCQPFDEQYINVARMKTLLATPVDEGGEPIAARFIPLSKPSLGPEEEEAVVGALRSGWLTSGPQIRAFEQAFAETVSAPYAVSVSSCTAALHLSLAAYGVAPGDEVITSPITWASTGNTMINMGAVPRFVDVEPDTLNMDPAQLEAAITAKTKVIMPVHMAGHPCDLEAIHQIADKHGIPVVEDAAHALGAAYRGKEIGRCSPLSCFSFYAIKNITTMEGGMVSCLDGDLAERVRLLSTNGMSATAWERYGRSAAPGPLEVIAPGYKYALNNVGAAMGLVQIRKFASFKAARARIAGMYNAVLSDVDEITLPPTRDYAGHAWHLYIIRLKLDKLRQSRDEIAQLLRRENVGTGIHFYALHLHQYYREVLGFAASDFPEAAAASEAILSLPLHPQMTDKNVHEVVAALKKVLHHARR